MDQIDDFERLNMEMDHWACTFCPNCDEDYWMPEDAGTCIMCGEDLDGTLIEFEKNYE